MYNYTVIIPHYNIPRLLERCVNSIPMREDVQVIVVDDCSPKSKDINITFEKLRQRPNLELYSTPKGGSAGRARNVGLDNAKGKWLVFADADDFFDIAVGELLDSCLNASEDVIYFRCRSVMSNDINIPSQRISNESKYFTASMTKEIELHFRTEIHVPWGKIIKRNFIEDNQIRFDETLYANDAMFAVLTGCKANSINLANINAYVLTERPDSLCGNFFRKSGEAGIRAKVALRVNKVIAEYGYDKGYNDPEMFIKLVVLNHDFSALCEILCHNEDYGVTKPDILRIVRATGKRYFPIYLWLKLVSYK